VPDLERIQQLTPGTLQQQWYEDGIAVDPGTVTIGITRWDGTILVAAGTGTSGAGTNPRTFSLTTTHTALLDRLTVTWTSSGKGTLVSYLEIAGGFVFALSELTAVKPANLTWTTAQMVAMRTTVEQAIEEEYGTALVPRYTRETVSGTGYSDATLTLRGPIRAIRDVVVAGTALTAGQLAVLAFEDAWLSGYTWPLGAGNVTVGYEYGLSYPPPRVRQAAVLLARSWLVRGPVDDRALGAASPDGGFSFGLATPGRGGSLFGLPELDAVVLGSPYRIGVA
jgi:hypothetical protein